MRNRGGGEQGEDPDDDLTAGGQPDQVGLSSDRAGVLAAARPFRQQSYGRRHQLKPGLARKLLGEGVCEKPEMT
jgi:hypothetical protein